MDGQFRGGRGEMKGKQGFWRGIMRNTKFLKTTSLC